jgi:non-ribosomal peptide synthetase-like protein
VLVERASTGFRPLRPKYCSIYDIDFWRTERFFKLEAGGNVALFDGTPFKSVVLRLLGARIGKRLFDDGGQMAEKNLVTIGDNVTINASTWIQCHSQEDYAFKSDRITIGSGCTLGVGTEMLYSVTIGDGAVVASNSFLMKGSEIPPGELWGGNPAQEMPNISTTLGRVSERDLGQHRPHALLRGRRNNRHRSAALVGAGRHRANK